MGKNSDTMTSNHSITWYNKVNKTKTIFYFFYSSLEHQ